MTNVFTVHRTVCVMKCVPLEECGGARNYVGHYHLGVVLVNLKGRRRTLGIAPEVSQES